VGIQAASQLAHHCIGQPLIADHYGRIQMVGLGTQKPALLGGQFNHGGNSLKNR
jgi:hypothetical protein